MKKFTLPDTLPSDLAELAKLKDRAAAELAVWVQTDQSELDTEDADRIVYLTKAVKDIDTATAGIVAAAEADQARIAEALAQAVEATKPKPEQEAAVVAEAETITAEAAQEEPVVASADRQTQIEAKAVEFTSTGNLPVDIPTGGGEELGWRLLPTAADYTPDQGGRNVTFADIARSMLSVSAGNGSGLRPSGTAVLSNGAQLQKQAFAVLQRPEAPVVTGDNAVSMLDKIASEIPRHGKLSTQALTAAGGWCAPSERTWSFCDVPNATELLSLPEFSLGKRGGFIWPNEPDITALLADDSFMWNFTEAQMVAVDGQGKPTAVKPIPEVPCPTGSTEVRLEAIGWAFKAGILQAQAWPELIEWWLKTFTAAWLRAISRKSIAKMIAGSTLKTIPPGAATGAVAATSATLNALSLMAQNLRLKRGLPQEAPVEMVAPVWFRDVIRADMTLREDAATLYVSDQQIQSLFTQRNIFPQFVADWQTRATGLPGVLDTLTYPKTADVLLYPAGTWFRHLNPVITLGTMYPLEQLTVNRYTHQFVEDAFQVFKRCNDSLLVRVPTCVTGSYGAPTAITCASAAA